MKFPDTFPPECPLQSAFDCDGPVYKLFRSTPPSAEQCRTHAERGLASEAEGESACLRHGLSVFPSYQSCIHQRDLLPHLGAHIGVADLAPAHGRVASTRGRQPVHHTWWPYEGVVRHPLFNIMEGH